MKPILIGLTGSIGMGKSTTSAMFAELGVPVWDADAAVHRLYGVGGAAVSAISALCPKAIADGAVDRMVLKSWIAKDPGALKQIEQIVHPLVAADREAFINKASAPVILLDIPLLFETGNDKMMDTVVVVSTTAKEQRRRVLERGTMSEKQFEAILEKQLPDAEKRDRADYVIETADLDSTREAVKQVLQNIRKGTADA